MHTKGILHKMIDFINPIYTKTDEELLADLGALIKQRRINANYTQQEFANIIGISKDQLSKIERTGKTTMATFIAISRKFGLLQQLLDIYKLPELTPMQRYEIEQKTAKIKTKRQRVKK